MTKNVVKADSPQSLPTSASDRDILLAAKGGSISFAGNLSVYAFRFVFGVVMARLLGAELLGLYTLGLTIADFGAAMALLGLGVGLARYVPIAIAQKDDARLWGIIQVGVGLPLLLSVALALGVFVLAEPLSIRLFQRPDLVPVLRLASFGIPLLVMITALTSITQGFKRMEYQVYSEDIGLNLLKLILSVALVLLGLGVVGAVLAQNIALMLTVGMLLFFVHRLFPLNRPVRTAKRNTREMLAFALPLYLSRLLSRFSGSLETLLLASFGLISGVGIYTAALRLSAIGSMFHGSLQRIAVPMISELYSRRELDQLKRVYRTLTKWGMTFNLPIFLTVAFFAEPLLSIFGYEFVAGANGLVILAFGYLFNASTGVCGTMVTMTGHSRLTLANSLANLGVNLVLDLLLIPRWGVLGAALAVTLTVMLLNSARTIQVLVLLRIWPYDRTFLKPTAAALAASGAVLLVRHWLPPVPMLVQLAVGALLLWSVYSATIVLLKLSEEDRLVLDRVGARLFSWRS
jgi:O-antigen/teichoic acid export membrane protein